MKERHGEIEALGGRVVAVSFTPPEKATAYLQRHPLPFPAVVDPSLEAYRRFELGRTSWREMLRPSVLARYLKLMLRGGLPVRAARDEDLMQLGGDFVLDADRRLVFAYRSADPADRPSATALVEAIRATIKAEKSAG